ncbi:helix-turn-helix transcriptional regulator [Chitinophaga agrisoli]|uniref:Helix-turn-helix transcriptional regulator n=1 Tax=Chitinophaga agrisoli TaxID=2607653 RepID=A0A5B2VMK7_9BACT|nr:AraC family transcriptional regulator [Chitinophaga agrisoli]KAA2240873.1 helix-turn-helix transcriptional regulator [Chitinophaga agrisoli]
MMQYHVSGKMMAYITVSNEIPKSHQQHRLAAATYIEFTQGPFGAILLQRVVNGDWTVQLAQFFISRQVRLYPVAQQPLGILHCMLEGRIPCILQGFGDVMLREKEWRFFYVPAGKRNTAMFSKGYYESFQIGLSPAYLSRFAHNGSPLREVLRRLEHTLPEGYEVGPCPLSLQTLDQVEKMRHTQITGPTRNLYYQARINDLMLLYLASLEQMSQQRNKTVARYEKEMKQLADYIADNLEKQLIVPQLAAKMGLHVQIVEKEFKKVHLQTIKSFILEQRMKRARYLLTEGKMPIVEIAYTVGYGDAAYFSNVFKKQSGITPTAYQKAKKDSTDKPLP